MRISKLLDFLRAKFGRTLINITMREFGQKYGVIFALILLFAYNAALTPYFLTKQSLIFILLRQAAPVAIVAVGMAIVVGTGGIDLSVGSVMAIAGQLGALIVISGQNFLLAILIALLVSAAIGIFNGSLIVFAGVQPIIATLILFIAGRGIAQLITGGNLLPLAHPDFQWIGIARPFSIPTQVFEALIVVLFLWFVMKFTVFGSRVLSVGGNEVASKLSGIPVAKVKILAYTISAVLAGFVGLISVSATSASDANNIGLGMELDAIAAVAVGGTPLLGGKVRIWNTAVGALMLRLLQNTLIAHGVTKEISQIVIGVVIIVALWLQWQGGQDE